MLVDHGADPRAKNKGGLDCMWYGLFSDDPASVLPHLSRLGAVADAVDASTGYGIMHLAAERGHLKTMSHVRKLGQDIEMRNLRGETPLFAAVRSGLYETAAWMVNVLGCDVEAQNNYAMRPLHVAAHELLVNVVHRLLEVGADINCRDKLGRTPLMLASGQNDTSRTRGARAFLGSDQVGVVGYLLDNKADIHVRSKRGLFALHFAAICGRQDVASLLLLRGANVNATTRLGRTALHLAAATGHENVIRMLVRHGARVSARDRRGCCALYMACATGHASAVSTLLQLDAVTSDSAASSGRTPLEAAARGGHLKVVRLLLERAFVDGCTVDRALRSALRHKKEDVVSVLEESMITEQRLTVDAVNPEPTAGGSDVSRPSCLANCVYDGVLLSQISEITEDQEDVDSWVTSTALIPAPDVEVTERVRVNSIFGTGVASCSSLTTKEKAKYLACADAEHGLRRDSSMR